MNSENKPFYFAKLELENICSFGNRQCLNLLNEAGYPAQWTVILGDNGVGKTTLLQCLARMRPQLNEKSDDGEGQPKRKIEPEIIKEEDNDVLLRLTRSGASGIANILAEFIACDNFDRPGDFEGQKITIGIEIESSEDDIEDVTPIDTENEYFVEPLVLAYGAGRHMGIRNFERAAETGPVESLFNVGTELVDAEEMLWRFEYHKLKERKNDEIRLKKLKSLLVEILPDLNDLDDIEIRGPVLPGLNEKESGVWFRTPSGTVQLDQLSLGYQTVMAWIVDIAWRMINHYPDCVNPQREPAVVIVDEIDLHLHPKWQREIRNHLTGHFPRVQFITTAHSPLMAQDALDTNLAVVKNCSGQSVIESNPAIVKTWRLDQVLTSDLFGVQSSRPVHIERSMERRARLVQQDKLTKSEQNELRELDALIESLHTAELATDQAAMNLIRKIAKKFDQKPNDK